VGNNSESPHELWTETLGAFGKDHRLCKLCSCPCGKATWGHAVCSKDYGNCLILWFVQRSNCTRSCGDHHTRLEASGFG
jgi:hypothetical protein